MANALIMAPLAMPAVSASSTVRGPASNVANDYMGIVWSATADGSYLTIDMGADVAVDTIALLGVRGAAGAATLTVRAATNAQGSGFGVGAYWTDSAVALYAGSNRLQNGAGVSLWRAPAGAPAAARYWRLIFGGIGGGGVQISRAALGKAITMARNFTFGGGFGIKDFSKVEFSDLGALLRRRGKRKIRTAALKFAAIKKADIEATIQPMIEQLGNTDCLLLVTDPDADAMRERRCFFGPMVGDLGTIQARASGFEWAPEVWSLA